MRKYRVLFISSHFPNRTQPERATYNRQQISHLAKLCEVKVVAPYAYFPLLKYGNKGARLQDIPHREIIEGVEVFHPPYFYTPKFFPSLYGIFYFLSILNPVKRIYRRFPFEVIYTNWLYPDSFAAMLIARYFRKNFVSCALGSDVNLYMKYPLRKRMILTTIKNSYKALCVSEDLKRKLIKQGISSEHIEVLYDGVDSQLFTPQDRSLARKKLGINPKGKIILYVGNLEPWKGPEYLLEAFSLIPQRNNLSLFFVGDGPERKKLEKFVRERKISRVHFAGKKSHTIIPLWMNACDVLCIPSLTEGVPNVMLEAWACGKPVIASRVGGIPELMHEEVGIMVPPGNPRAIADALEKGLSKRWDEGKIREYALKFSWEENALRLFQILKTACQEP